MNGMLGRVEDATDRQRRFVADASHELRSPLTRIRTELEVDEAHPASADRAATARSTLEEVVGMQAMVEDLLHLARADAGAGARANGGAAPVPLGEVVRGAASDLGTATGRVVDTTAVVDVVVPGERGPLRRLVTNLLDNAHRHAGDRVAVELRAEGGRAVLVVVDDGPGIPADERERVFGRFTRLDEARTAGSGGTGLGLAIVREIAERHGGHAVAAEPVGTEAGARIVVTLPIG